MSELIVTPQLPANPTIVPPESVRHGEEANPFVPSVELGDQLTGLFHAQAEIDRRAAEDLARLRALQDRD